MKADDKGEFSSAISKWIVCFFCGGVLSDKR